MLPSRGYARGVQKLPHKIGPTTFECAQPLSEQVVFPNRPNTPKTRDLPAFAP